MSILKVWLKHLILVLLLKPVSASPALVRLDEQCCLHVEDSYSTTLLWTPSCSSYSPSGVSQIITRLLCASPWPVSQPQLITMRYCVNTISLSPSLRLLRHPSLQQETAWRSSQWAFSSPFSVFKVVFHLERNKKKIKIHELRCFIQY